jgi:hypothetical protein
MSDATMNRFCYGILLTILALNLGGLIEPNQYQDSMNPVQKLVVAKKDLNLFAIQTVTDTASNHNLRRFEPTFIGLFAG